MIVVGAVLLILIVLAFAGRDLGVGRDGETTSGWESVLFCLLLIGVALKKQRERSEDEDC